MRNLSETGLGWRGAIEFLALVFVALSVVAPTAHLASLPNKIDVGRDTYFVMQRVYDGWWVLGLSWVAALCLSGLAALLRRRDRRAMLLWIGTCGLMLVTFSIFLIWTAPANEATANWTRMPDDWTVLRRQWELSHAVNALTTIAALCCAALAVLCPADDRAR